LPVRPNYYLGTDTPEVYYQNELAASSTALELLVNRSNANHIDRSAPVKGDLVVPILMYHYIAPTPTNSPLPHLYTNPVIFEEQIRAIYDAGYNSVLVRDVGEALAGRKNLPVKPIVITFDDGYEDFYTTAVPILKKYGLRGTNYVIVDAVDKPGYMTKKQLVELGQNPNIEIASHTLNHPNLKETEEAQARVELQDSKKRLAEIIGRSVDDFAYPFGFFRDRDQKLCQEAGYLTCASTYPGTKQTYHGRFTLYRLRPMYKVGDNLLQFINYKELANK